jgi:hypothetical protein
MRIDYGLDQYEFTTNNSSIRDEQKIMQQTAICLNGLLT